ncbi:single-stranded DNA-binding protein, partial [Mesorhizobium sp. M4B.F.Ca.ET.049.02.1.2]|uniref:single-stranded DNA-binding protein n=1 Tax=Mesorhizobium sp. M4B.F.Ca.ET.049.02.1.2 TaxID=2496752 RepID=UPI000FCB9660
GNVGSVAPFDKSTRVNIASARSWRAEQGHPKEANDWVQATILEEKQAAWLGKDAKPGDVVFLEGRISNNSFKRHGETVYTTDLIASTFNVFPKP